MNCSSCPGNTTETKVKALIDYKECKQDCKNDCEWTNYEPQMSYSGLSENSLDNILNGRYGQEIQRLQRARDVQFRVSTSDYRQLLNHMTAVESSYNNLLSDVHSFSQMIETDLKKIFIDKQISLLDIYNNDINKVLFRGLSETEHLVKLLTDSKQRSLDRWMVTMINCIEEFVTLTTNRMISDILKGHGEQFIHIFTRITDSVRKINDTYPSFLRVVTNMTAAMDKIKSEITSDIIRDVWPNHLFFYTEDVLENVNGLAELMFYFNEQVEILNDIVLREDVKEFNKLTTSSIPMWNINLHKMKHVYSTFNGKLTRWHDIVGDINQLLTDTYGKEAWVFWKWTLIYTYDKATIMMQKDQNKMRNIYNDFFRDGKMSKEDILKAIDSSEVNQLYNNLDAFVAETKIHMTDQIRYNLLTITEVASSWYGTALFLAHQLKSCMPQEFTDRFFNLSIGEHVESNHSDVVAHYLDMALIETGEYSQMPDDLRQQVTSKNAFHEIISLFFKPLRDRLDVIDDVIDHKSGVLKGDLSRFSVLHKAFTKNDVVDHDFVRLASI